MKPFAREGDNNGCKKPKKERKPRFAHDTSRLNQMAHTETYKLSNSKKEQRPISRKMRLQYNNHALLDVTTRIIITRGIYERIDS